MRYDDHSFRDVPILDAADSTEAYEVKGLARAVIDGRELKDIGIVGLVRRSCEWDLLYTTSSVFTVRKENLLSPSVKNIELIEYSPFEPRKAENAPFSLAASR